MEMTNIFRLINVPATEEDEDLGVSIGIDLKIGGQEIACPVTGPCRDLEALEAALKRLEDDLEEIIEKGRAILASPADAEPGSEDFSGDTSPQEIWEMLTRIEIEDEFIRQFNRLPEAQRLDVAEHVLTRCNIFQGRASLFAQRYDNATGLMA
jgi:hypothetical protein